MKNIFVCFLFAALLASCKNNSNEPANDVTLAGRIELIDSTNVMLPDFSGAIVSVDNTNLTATTDSFGHWEIQNVPEGEQNITATKAGFGTFHWYQQTFASGEYDLQTVLLARLPNVTPVIDSASSNSNDDFISLFVNPKSLTGHTWPVLSYCDLDSTTQPGDSHTVIAIEPAEPGNLSTGFPYYMLSSAGIRSGQTLYFSASTVFPVESGYSVGTNCQYYDPVNQHWQYASTGPKSNVIKFVMP